ncbi:MAG: hypothetical protein MPJ50_15735 [Pirellulales bacterium]|nr:hypothetical protein [Pirellulales bacterium]
MATTRERQRPPKDVCPVCQRKWPHEPWCDAVGMLWVREMLLRELAEKSFAMLESNPDGLLEELKQISRDYTRDLQAFHDMSNN